MAVYIAATVGTSAITNRYRPVTPEYEQKIAEITSAAAQGRLGELAESFFDAGLQGKESAEIQTVFKMIQKRQQGVDYVLRLLASDSDDSEFCAYAVGAALKKCKGISYSVSRLRGLVVNDYSSFRKRGVDSLVSSLRQIKDEAKDGVVEVCISGGFKGVIPVITVAAQILRLRAYYTYEMQGDLIEIPVLPFNFDWEAWDEFFYRLEQEPSSMSREEIDHMLAAGMADESGNLSVMGEMFKSYARDKLPHIPNVWGRMVEHLLFEYFAGEAFVTAGGERLEFAERSVRLNRVEFDLAFGGKKDKFKVFGEIKPVKVIFSGIEKLKKQAEAQAQVLKNIGAIEMCLFLYSRTGSINLKIINKILPEIKEIYKKRAGIALRVFTLNVAELIKKYRDEIDIVSGGKHKAETNDFSALLAAKISHGNVAEIK